MVVTVALVFNQPQLSSLDRRYQVERGGKTGPKCPIKCPKTWPSRPELSDLFYYRAELVVASVALFGLDMVD